MPLAEAQAVTPQLIVAEENPQRDRESLQQLATWAERYSPLVGLEEGPEPQSLLLNVSGCADCFGGEDWLLQRAARELAAEGWSTRLALADTIGAAWALAHHGGKPATALAPTGQMEAVLRPLPVAALRLAVETLDLLGRLGIERIEQLLALPRAGLVSRFGPELLDRLDQALGQMPETFAPFRCAPPVQAALPFDPPSDRRQAIAYALERLTERIHEVLLERNLGARQIECWLYHETAEPRRLEVNLFRPSQSLPYLRTLLGVYLERVKVAAPVSGMRLHVSRAEVLGGSQAELFDTEWSHAQEELAGLIDRLSSRLGREAVTRPALVPDPQPEYACRFEPLIQPDAASPKKAGKKPPDDEPPLFVRPLRLLPRPVLIDAVSVVPDGPPIQFHWAGTRYRIVCAWGPERIDTGWWRHAEALRDYYVVATHLGNRFWLFRQRDEGRWFVHGCFE